jgi:hypothetical protein
MSSTTAPPDVGPSSQPAAPPASGVRAWPVFRVHRVVREGRPDEVLFPCAACGLIDVVDESTAVCRCCWRPLALLAQALGDLRRELLDELRKDDP